MDRTNIKGFGFVFGCIENVIIKIKKLSLWMKILKKLCDRMSRSFLYTQKFERNIRNSEGCVVGWDVCTKYLQNRMPMY